jgi:SAM-dependent methyltransferase
MHSLSAVFDGLAETFALFDSPRLDGPEVSFYRSLTTLGSRPIADLGIGWGRLASLINPDFGVDYSPQMLEVARRRAPDVQMLLADIEEYSLPSPAGYSYAAMSTLDTIGSTDNLAKCLRNVYRETKLGGIFAFDSLWLSGEELSSFSGTRIVERSSGNRLLTSEIRVVDESSGQYEVCYALETYRHKRPVSIRKFPGLSAQVISPLEYRIFLLDAGWRIVGAWGGFRGEHLSSGKGKQVWIVRRDD